MSGRVGSIRSRRIMFRTSWLVLACTCLHTATAWAVDPARLISQYAHTAWRVQDGFFRGSPYTFVQTTTVICGSAPIPAWCDTTACASCPGTPRRNGQLPNYRGDTTAGGPRRQPVDSHVRRPESVEGSPTDQLSGWARRSRDDPRGPPRNHLVRTPRSRMPTAESSARWRSHNIACLGHGRRRPDVRRRQRLGRGSTTAISGFGGDKTLLHWSPDLPVRVSTKRAAEQRRHSPASRQSPRRRMGRSGSASAKPGPGLGLQRLVEGRLESFRTPQLDGSTLSVSTLYLDREGSLWIGTLDRGLYRVLRRRSRAFRSAGAACPAISWSR